jgi:outer membrane protein assembly factor BamB
VVWRKAAEEIGSHRHARFKGGMAFAGDGTLRAFDLETGEAKWHQNLPGYLSCNPNIEDGHIYVGTKDGSVHVVDCQTGEFLLSLSVDFEPKVVRPMSGSRLVVASFEVVGCYQLTQ